jgi:hypothetical protein
MSEGFVYLLRSDKGQVKVGRAADFIKRYKGYSNPTLPMLGVVMVNNFINVERTLIDRFDEKFERIRNTETFYCDPRDALIEFNRIVSSILVCEKTETAVNDNYDRFIELCDVSDVAYSFKPIKDLLVNLKKEAGENNDEYNDTVVAGCIELTTNNRMDDIVNLYLTGYISEDCLMKIVESICTSRDSDNDTKFATLFNVDAIDVSEYIEKVLQLLSYYSSSKLLAYIYNENLYTISSEYIQEFVHKNGVSVFEFIKNKQAIVEYDIIEYAIQMNDNKLFERVCEYGQKNELYLLRDNHLMELCMTNNAQLLTTMFKTDIRRVKSIDSNIPNFEKYYSYIVTETNEIFQNTIKDIPSWVEYIKTGKLDGCFRYLDYLCYVKKYVIIDLLIKNKVFTEKNLLKRMIAEKYDYVIAYLVSKYENKYNEKEIENGLKFVTKDNIVVLKEEEKVKKSVRKTSSDDKEKTKKPVKKNSDEKPTKKVIKKDEEDKVKPAKKAVKKDEEDKVKPAKKAVKKVLP